ncbi:MAG TPA: hypothetical protein VGL99_08815 [Chloroflexota bacterium]|jgi:hypothetical protein
MAEERDRHQTLNDDRAALDLDAEVDSPLVAGEGAPLAEDGVADKPRAKDVVMKRALLGGAQLGTVLPSDGDPGPRDPMVAPDDEPIGD